MDKKQEECCPPFDPKPWDGKTLKWKEKKFIKDRVRSILHIPVNFGQVVIRNMAKMEAAGAKNREHIMLVDENSLWGADVFISVDREVPGAEMVTLTGTFLTKVYEGPFKDLGSWTADFKKYVASKGKDLRQLYYWYTTCPACARKYGKNYVVLSARV
ncbi:MAG TPA: hypothetical protein ENN60_02690 [archaeon]|nr:hypothetical protein [archaeon]